MANRGELLSPAGSYEAACAAFQYGADAVYLGLSRHSARAEAVNFTAEELASITAYAHSLQPRRSVYVAVNTLVRDDELPGLLESLEACENAAVDGVILQDLAVYRLVHRYFPTLHAHASTQMAVHNREGAEAMAELGFTRVVLARELSFDEIRDITANVPVETEVFIHGALCYAYSGLCLFSALRLNRSGNRGQCAYCCRGAYEGPKGARAYPFSMRDLYQLDHVRELRDAGVASLKIEGRMKSPLYVAATTDLYRRKLDGQLEDSDTLREAVSNLQTVFSRPYTQLYLEGRPTPPEKIIDAVSVGHRGSPIGHVTGVRRDPEGQRWLAFAPQRPLEVHDGLQVELPEGGHPYGFAVDRMRRAGETRTRISVPSRMRVEVELPPDAPVLPKGAPLFCSASQAVRRAFGWSRPRSTECHAAIPIDVRVTLARDGFRAFAKVKDADISASVSEPGELTPAQHPERTEETLRKVFGKLGETRWGLGSLTIEDSERLFAPVSLLNNLRRALTAALDEQFESDRIERNGMRSVSVAEECTAPLPVPPLEKEERSVKVCFARKPKAFADTDEVVLALSVEDCRSGGELLGKLHAWQAVCPRVRVALPLIVRGKEADAVEKTVRDLLADGVRDWECADLAGLHLLHRLAGDRKLSITADGSLYCFNRLAANHLIEQGISGAVAPAEADIEQLETMGAYGSNWLIVPIRWRPPLFISETRPIVPWVSPSSTRFKLEDRSGWTCEVSRHDGRWLTRDTTSLDHTDDLPALRAAGFRRFRYDFTDE